MRRLKLSPLSSLSRLQPSSSSRSSTSASSTSTSVSTLRHTSSPFSTRSLVLRSPRLTHSAPHSRTRCYGTSNAEGKPIRRVIALCHGSLGIAGLLGSNYFKAIRPLYETLGAKHVYVPALTDRGGIKSRAEELHSHLLATKKQLDEKEDADFRFNIIGHSMGGLDARYIVSHLDGHQIIDSIITIGTPHRGSSMADLMINIERGLQRVHPSLQTAFNVLKLPMEGYRDMMIEAMREFNVRAPDHPSVKYFSFAAVQKVKPYHPLFTTYMYVKNVEGENDGLVSLQSQLWGRHIKTYDANHLEQINWFLFPNKHFNAVEHLYTDIWTLLRQENLLDEALLSKQEDATSPPEPTQTQNIEVQVVASPSSLSSSTSPAAPSSSAFLSSQSPP